MGLTLSETSLCEKLYRLSNRLPFEIQTFPSIIHAIIRYIVSLKYSVHEYMFSCTNDAFDALQSLRYWVDACFFVYCTLMATFQLHFLSHQVLLLPVGLQH